MAKWYGKIGYAEQIETAPGVWEEKTNERQYYGDVVRNVRKLEPSGEVNDNINVSMDISLGADQCAVQYIHALRYVGCMGG